MAENIWGWVKRLFSDKEEGNQLWQYPSHKNKSKHQKLVLFLFFTLIFWRILYIYIFFSAFSDILWLPEIQQISSTSHLFLPFFFQSLSVFVIFIFWATHWHKTFMICSVMLISWVLILQLDILSAHISPLPYFCNYFLASWNSPSRRFLKKKPGKKYFLRSCIFKTVCNIFTWKSAWLDIKSLHHTFFTSLLCRCVTLI